jgi:hypothetical protein
MASFDVAQFRPLAERHIADCLALSAEAGWNQTAEDWALFLRHGIVFGLPAARGGTVATGAVLPYPDDFAWISMVLVTEPRRRERIGTSVLEMCCTEIAQQGLVPVLDATPAGERVYRLLGFEGIFNIARWQGVAERNADPPVGVRAMTGSDISTVTQIDAAAFGADRAFLLESLFDRLPQLAFMTEDGIGFLLARPGRLATQIGPIVAANDDAAAALIDAALGRTSGPVFLDVVDGQPLVTRRLRQRGFVVQRPFLRMSLKRRLPFGDPAHLFVVAGPEFG